MQGESSLQRTAPNPVRRIDGARRWISRERIGGAALLLGGPALLIGVLSWPMLFTSNGFNEDWLHHLWYMWNQSLTIREDHHPSFFLNNANSVFYPEFAFYGGTLYALLGTLSLLLGDSPIETYVLTYLLTFAAAYGGWYWIARIAGVRGWRACVPGVLLITSSYYLTLIYARGDLAELIGVSTISLMIASGFSVLRAERLNLWAALVFTGSVIVFFGSHSLTMIWGSTLMALSAVIALLVIPELRSWRRRAMLRVLALGIPAFLVNAWFLLPAVAYESHTRISSKFTYWKHLLRSLTHVVSAQRLFTPSRASVFASAADFALSLPVLAMAWVLVALVLCWRGGSRGAWTRMMLICSGVAALVTVMMTHAGLIVLLPRPYAILQFSYRLESYIVMAVAGAVLAGLAAARGGSRPLRLWTWVLVPILIVTTVGAIQQVGARPHSFDRQTAIESRVNSNFTIIIPIDYTDANLPLRVDRYARPPELIFPPTAVHSERISMVVHLHPGEWVYSNIGAGPEFVDVSGARIIGINHIGSDVLEIGPSISAAKAAALGQGGSRWTEVISVRPANRLPVVLGRILSLAAVAFLVGAFALLAVRRLRAAARERPASVR